LIIKDNKWWVLKRSNWIGCEEHRRTYERWVVEGGVENEVNYDVLFV